MIAAIVTTANASLISYKSTSPADQPVFVEQGLNRADRRGREPLRRLRVAGVTDDAGQRLQVVLTNGGSARDEQRSGAVGDRRQSWRR